MTKFRSRVKWEVKHYGKGTGNTKDKIDVIRQLIKDKFIAGIDFPEDKMIVFGRHGTNKTTLRKIYRICRRSD